MHRGAAAAVPRPNRRACGERLCPSRSFLRGASSCLFARPGSPRIFAEFWGGSADLRSELSRHNPAKFSRIFGSFRRPGSQIFGRNPRKFLHNLAAFRKKYGPIREIWGLVQGATSGKFRARRVVFTSSRFLDLLEVQNFRRWPKNTCFLPLVWKNAFRAKKRRRSYLFAPRSGMFACWSGIFACWSGTFACTFGEIEGNTQIEQKKAVGKKHAQLPQVC